MHQPEHNFHGPIDIMSDMRDLESLEATLWLPGLVQQHNHPNAA